MQYLKTQLKSKKSTQQWFLIEINTFNFNTSSLPKYFILQENDIWQRNAEDYVSFWHNNGLMEGNIIFAATNRHVIVEKLDKLTTINLLASANPIAKPKYFLLQFSKGNRDIVQGILPESHVFWPTGIQPDQREVLVFDGSQPQVATVLLILDDLQQIMIEFEKLKIFCFEMGHDENDHDASIADDAWILVLYTCGPTNIVYTILNNRSTYWRNNNEHKDVLAYIKNGQNVYQTIIIRKSNNFQELQAQLNFMKSSCQVVNFPLQVDIFRTDNVPPPKFQSLCGTVEEFELNAKINRNIKLQLNVIELEESMSDENLYFARCFETLERLHEERFLFDQLFPDAF